MADAVYSDADAFFENLESDFVDVLVVLKEANLKSKRRHLV